MINLDATNQLDQNKWKQQSAIIKSFRNICDAKPRKMRFRLYEHLMLGLEPALWPVSGRWIWSSRLVDVCVNRPGPDIWVIRKIKKIKRFFKHLRDLLWMIKLDSTDQLHPNFVETTGLISHSFRFTYHRW